MFIHNRQIGYVCWKLQLIEKYPAFPKIFQIVFVAEVDQRGCLEESGQWLENVNRTHQVLASCKLLPQKIMIRQFSIQVWSFALLRCFKSTNIVYLRQEEPFL